MIKKIIPKTIWIKLRFAKAAIERIAYRLLWVFPIDKYKIVFSNFNGKGYGDSPKYIAEEFVKRDWQKLYWLSTNSSIQLPLGIKPLRKGSLKAYYHIATAKIWVDNNRKDPYVVKRKGQFYLQTWHGSIPLKKIEQDAVDSLDEFYKSNAIRDSKMIDLMISDSAFSDQLYSHSFWYKGEVKRLGTPRFDPLFKLTDVDSIKQTLGVLSDQYVVLYAPTFRNNADATVYDIDLLAVKQAFEKKTGKSVVVLVRMHPNIPSGYIHFDDNIAQDVTLYPDIYDLMKVSDALITDYSSTIFEFSIAEIKPAFSYAKDRDNYDRGFYFCVDELPFLFARSNDELINGIEDFNWDEYKAALERFYAKIDLFADGRAAEHVVDYLLQRIGEK